jgi:hypothetical protein
MSIYAVQTVLEKSRARGGARLVHIALAWHANDENFWAWPSVETIQKKTLLGRTAISEGIGTLIEIGEIFVQEQGGPHGVNRYLLLLCTGGRITNALPNAEEAAMLKRVRKANTPERVGKSGHNKLGTLEIEKEGCIEWPSEEDVLQFAKEYPGSLAKGIPAGIPETWAKYHWHFRTYEKRDWAPDWKKAMVNLFEMRWQAGDATARGQFTSKQPGLGGQQKNGPGMWEKKQRLEALKKKAAEHPANEASSSNWVGATEEDLAEYQKLLEEIRLAEAEVAK